MSKLVLTVVGEDRPGLVRRLAEVVAARGGNWEQSELAELAGAFAGIVLVSIDEARVDDLISQLSSLDGLLQVTPHIGTTEAVLGSATAEERFVFTVLGNDQPGIVRDISLALAQRGLSIDRFTSRTMEAPMSGGTLFEATISVRVTADVDLDAAIAELERLAGEIQVDLTVA